MPAKPARLSTLATTDRRHTFTPGVSLPADCVGKSENLTEPSDNLTGLSDNLTVVAINQTILTACIAEVEPLRYTPAGLPALNLRLEHASEIQEAGQTRQVKAVLKSVAFGAMAERLVKQAIGSVWQFKGFLATPRNGKSVVFHIQEISQD